MEESFTETEFHSLSAEGFARERLGWWASENQLALVSQKEWAALCIPAAAVPGEGVKVFGVKFSADGASVALSVALKPKEGPPHVELIEYKSMRNGTAWLAEWLVERKQSMALVVVDGRSHVDSLVAQLREGGVSRLAICVPKSGDAIAAATRFHNAIREKKLTHIESPALDEAIVHCKKRPIGQNGGWGWGGIGETDSTPVESAALAYWGAVTTKRDPSRKLRIG